MDDANLRDQLRLIFPQIDVQRTINEALKTVENRHDQAQVDILTLCIQHVLDRQQAETSVGDTNDEGQDNDDVVIVKSIKKEHSQKAKTREIPIVFLPDDHGPNNYREPRMDLNDLSPIDFGTGSDDSSPMAFGFESDSDREIDFDDERREYIDYNRHGIAKSQPSATSNKYQDLPAPTKYRPKHTTATRDTILDTVRKPSAVYNAHQQTSVAPKHTILNKRPQASTVSNHLVTTFGTPNTPEHINPKMPSTPTMPTATSIVTSITQMFPKVNKDFVQNLSQQGYDLNSIVNTLLDRPDMQNYCPSEPQPSPIKPAEHKNIDYFKEYSKSVSSLCNLQCEHLLRNEFRRVSMSNIRKAIGMCNGHYAPARKVLEEALVAMKPDSCGYSTQSITSPPSTTKSTMLVLVRLLGKQRPIYSSHSPPNICHELQLEIDFLKEQAMLDEEKKNAIYAAHLNEEQYKDEGQLIECGCCFGEFPFEQIVQCSDGHLFCTECLRGYAKEIIFGSSMTNVDLTCMDNGCDEPFPYNQLKKCLTTEEIKKYQDRLQEDCLLKVEIPDLHQCPFCDFAAIMPEGERVFACMNPTCQKESCKECKEEWKEHFGLKCSEIEKKSQTNLRLSYEERMTMAKVRKCAKCSLTFTKLDGCNKMTCRCGTTQCYVCRKSKISYEHFCRHPRDPGLKCTKCVTCSLWTDPTEDDELAIKQIQNEATAAKRKLNDEIELSVKKQKV